MTCPVYLKRDNQIKVSVNSKSEFFDLSSRVAHEKFWLGPNLTDWSKVTCSCRTLYVAEDIDDRHFFQMYLEQFEPFIIQGIIMVLYVF